MVSLSLKLAAAACLATTVNAQHYNSTGNSTGNDGNITSDTYFYGQSPSVLPSPQMPGSDKWKVARRKAQALVAQMTLEERANITVGYGSNTGCAGITGSVPRLGWAGLCLADAGQGLRATDFVNAYPAGIHSGASWNRELTYDRALHMGREYKRKGVHVLLGPVIGGMGRVAQGGRNWEAFSNDPYLCGKLGYETISGIQDAGVTASVKHYIANEQEAYRNPLHPGTGGGGAVGNEPSPGLPSYGPNPYNFTIEALSSNVDDKTMHELYLWPFQDAVHAGAGSVMCAYQRINNSYACHNQKTQNGLLKGELGFEGFIVTDWTAIHAGVASAEGGLDLAMPSGSIYWGTNGSKLVDMVNNGSIEESRLTDMATRILATWYQMGQDTGFPDIAFPANYSVPHKSAYARDPSSQPVLLAGAKEGNVLVKNTNNILPLKSPRILSVFGYDAVAPPDVNLASTAGGYRVGFLANYGADYVASILYPHINLGPISPNGTLITGGGSGGTAPPYISAPLDALQERAYKEHTQIFWDVIQNNPQVHAESDACLVFINAWATEGYDRTELRDDYSDALVLNVARQCANTIVVIHNAGIRLVDQFADHPNVTAIIFGHLPGQDSGRGLVSLLFGDESFSGRLPYTVARNETDYNAVPEGQQGEFFRFPQSDFTEGVYIDYKDFDRKNITPRYEFGFGLTYTTFEYTDIQTTIIRDANTSYAAPEAPILEGGQESLWDPIAVVSATVTNTGDYLAKEVAQLYVHIPGGPIRQLRGFEKIEIAPGRSEIVRFTLTRKDLSEWNVVEQAWRLQQAAYQVWVGSSSRNLPLDSEVVIGQ